jgi:hypothetical protein
MLTYADAERLARTWVDVISQGTGTVCAGRAIAKSYGWVFFWDSREFIETKNPRKRIAGNAPVIVDRVDGEVRVTGTAEPLEYYLSKYEASLPPARLQMRPEQPPEAG